MVLHKPLMVKTRVSERIEELELELDEFVMRSLSRILLDQRDNYTDWPASSAPVTIMVPTPVAAMYRDNSSASNELRRFLHTSPTAVTDLIARLELSGWTANRTIGECRLSSMAREDTLNVVTHLTLAPRLQDTINDD